MADRSARDIIDLLRKEVEALDRFSDGKPLMTDAQRDKYVLVLIEVVDRLDKRLQAIEKKP